MTAKPEILSTDTPWPGAQTAIDDADMAFGAATKWSKILPPWEQLPPEYKTSSRDMGLEAHGQRTGSRSASPRIPPWT